MSHSSKLYLALDLATTIYILFLYVAEISLPKSIQYPKVDLLSTIDCVYIQE